MMSQSKFNFESDFLEGVIESSTSLFVCDNNGIILLANPACSKLLGISVDELMGNNIRTFVRKGYYDRSTALDAIEQKKEITGIINVSNGVTLISNSRPIFDQFGNVTLVVTDSRDMGMVEKFTSILEEEKAKVELYKQEVQHLRSKQQVKRNIIAHSKAMQEIIFRATLVAPTDSTVLLNGESGTGKEVVAQFIHGNSNRKDNAFITVNCAAIPEHLIESELLGYEKGAFTGASSKGKAGMFELSDKGTIFLDEIAELPMAVQPKLLRVLETNEVRRVGGTNTKKLDLRVIAATNKDLFSMVEEKNFREDLYYRLNVIPLELPPLRERPEDIIALAELFLQHFNKKYRCTKKYSQRVLNDFLTYKWPGNVRELRNVVERLVITTTGEEIFWYDIDPVFKRKSCSVNIAEKTTNENIIVLPKEGTLKEVLTIVEDKYIQQVINDCDGAVVKAAKKLGIHRSVLYRKMRKPKNVKSNINKTP